METPLKLIIAGLVLLLIGAILPFVMVIRLVTPTLVLSFISYACSTAGLVLGFIGIAQHVRARR